MNNIIKLSSALGGAAVSMAFCYSIAFADTTNLTNTGDKVDVQAGSSNHTNVTVNNSNNANINQSSDTNINTGGNTANRNIGDVSIDTGNANVTNAFSAQANANKTVISGLGGGTNNTTNLTNTGDYLNVHNNGGDSTNVRVNNNNDAYLNQYANSNVNTGDNKANRNIGDVIFQPVTLESSTASQPKLIRTKPISAALAAIMVETSWISSTLAII
jgi:hypothetical protein